MRKYIIIVTLLAATMFVLSSMTTSTEKVTICHYVGDNGNGPKKGCAEFFKIEVSINAVNGHLRHGDHIHGSRHCEMMGNH